MARFIRVLFGTTSTLAACLALGFGLFVQSIGAWRPSDVAVADAIVVLSGDEARISEGLELLHRKRGSRLLISGITPSTGVPAEVGDWIKRQTVLAELDCCVDIGYEALDTVGNARESREWVSLRGYRSLLVVTSGYHMPRSLVEFRRAMPEVTLISHPVGAQQDTHYLVREYGKFLVAAARFGAGRLLDAGETVMTAALRAVVSSST